jgi:hypothetical protein
MWLNMEIKEKEESLGKETKEETIRKTEKTLGKAESERRTISYDPTGITRNAQ